MLTVMMVLAQILVGTNANTTIKIGDFDINNARCKKRLRVKFDHRLIFDDQVSGLCHKASCKIHALARIASQMNLKKRHLMMNTFFTSQFNNCSLIGVFHSQKKSKQNQQTSRWLLCKKFVMTNNYHLNSHWKKMDLSLFTKNIFTKLLLRSTK